MQDSLWARKPSLPFFMTKICLGLKILIGTQIFFGSHNKFAPKTQHFTFLGPKFLWTINFFGPKFFSNTKFFSDPKFFSDQEFVLDPKSIFRTKNLFWTQTLFWT